MIWTKYTGARRWPLAPNPALESATIESVDPTPGVTHEKGPTAKGGNGTRHIAATGGSGRSARAEDRTPPARQTDLPQATPDISPHMKRFLVAASAAAIAVPALATVSPVQAQAAPTTAVSTAQATSAAHPSRNSLVAARTQAVRKANVYSRQSAKVSWRQKDRNARHLSTLSKRAKMAPHRRAALISHTQKGTMYRWGGTTPRGFDCSGYTRYVYNKAGKSLPRTARSQYAATKRTSRPAPGDLVFFGGRNAHHVGIYLGKGRMIHSPRSGKPVQVTKVWRGASYGKVR